MSSLLPEPQAVISASRRTDLARCFPEVLAGWLSAGRVGVPNPYNRKVRDVDLRPENVHTLLLWSKDYQRLLANEHGLRDKLRAYAQLFFQITLTGLGGTALEPGVAKAQTVARQFSELVALAGNPERVSWRFDPIVAWQADGRVKTNLAGLDEWMRAAADAGLTRVTVSLCQEYAKLHRRFARAGLTRVVPTPTRARTLAAYLLETGARHGLEVQACCCPPLTDSGVKPAACVDAGLLTRLHPEGRQAPTGKDPGQRPGCGCTPSTDIGDYALACPQGCLYCYANPK
ncbi:MAG: DUF1848 domain-containing protein [Candidatus Firestonebacteria bacterium]|nr:DUF1848 domain-containing protein [Candidatus Firestonebacteria bacterium]